MTSSKFKMAAHGYFGHTHTNPNKSLSGFLWTKPLTATVAAVTSGLLTIVKTGITIVSYFGNVAASLFALTIVRKFTPR